MSSDSVTADSIPGDDDPDDGLSATLRRVYYRYIGEPNKERDIYLGFGSFFTGLVLGAVAFVIFLCSAFQKYGSDIFWQLREIALVAGVIALPAVVLSIVILLPVGRRTLAISAVGSVLCIVAAGMLVSMYPDQWARGTDATLNGSVRTIAVYTVGLVLLSAATGTALVAQYLEHKSLQLTDATEADGVETDESSVTDGDVQSDIDSSLSDVELSWGGVEKSASTKRLSLNKTEIDDLDDTEAQKIGATTVRSEGNTVNDAVNGLRQLQGGETNTARAESSEDKVSALTEIRDQQAAESVETGVDDEQGVLTRVRGWLFQ
jgi:hypothetical protein